MNKSEDISSRFINAFEYLENTKVIKKRGDAAALLQCSAQVLTETLKERMNPTTHLLQNFFKAFNISPDYIFLGTGGIIKSATNNNQLSTLNESTVNYVQNLVKGVPLVGVEALGGLGNSEFRIEKKDIVAYYDIDEFKEADFYFKMKGKSMLPYYPHGAMLACKRIYEEKNIQWGMPYLIASQVHGLIVKRITKSKTPKHWTLISDNGNLFQPFDIVSSEVDGIALVLGNANIHIE